MDKRICGIDILLYEQFNLLDVAGPVQAFCKMTYGSKPLYTLRYVSLDGGLVHSSCGLAVQSEKRSIRSRRTTDLLIPGGEGVDAAICKPELLELVRKSHNSATESRLISICSGALLLAAAGLLSGRLATTHWDREQQVLHNYPDTQWQVDRLYCRDGNIYTSAGVTAGIDLALSIIEQDHGGSAALTVARELVVSIRRGGGQSQYSDLLTNQFSEDSVVSRVMTALTEAPCKAWSLDSMASYANVTPRTLSRKFQSNIGTSPIKALEKTRVRLASGLISEGLSHVKAVHLCGFESEQNMQRSFKRVLGVTVGEYRKKFSHRP